MPLLTSCAGLWSGPFLCSCLHGTKRPTERTRYALNAATLAYILNTVHRVLYFTCRCIYLSEGKQCSPNFIAACLGIWSQDNCTVHFFLSTNWNNISRLTGTSFISGTSICLQYPRSYKSNNVTVMLNILIEVSNCFSVGSSYTCIPTGQKTPIRYQHSIRNIKYWLSCTSPFRLITRVSESKWCLFCVTYLYLSYFRALNTQFQFCRAAESIWLLFWDWGNAVAVAAKQISVGDCSSPATTTALLLSSTCCDRREMGTGMLERFWGLHLVSRAALAALAHSKGEPHLSSVSSNGPGASADGQILSYQNAA